MEEHTGTGYTSAVITVSDRSAAGEREDASGPALQAFLEENGYRVLRRIVVADEQRDIQSALRTLVKEDIALILTTGGTGFSPRDVTPEATIAVCERMTPGIPEVMRAHSMRITPHGCLSRGVAGIRERSLIINLPGSPKAAKENLEPVLQPVAHGLKMLRGGPADCAAESSNT